MTGRRTCSTQCRASMVCPPDGVIRLCVMTRVASTRQGAMPCVPRACAESMASAAAVIAFCTVAAQHGRMHALSRPGAHVQPVQDSENC